MIRKARTCYGWFSVACMAAVVILAVCRAF